MGRTRVRWGRLVVVTATVAAAGFGTVRLAAAASPERATAAHVYVVEPGDTLWAIASRLKPRDDPRATVDRLVRSNHVRDGIITPGERLIVDP